MKQNLIKGSLLLMVIVTAREYARWTFDPAWAPGIVAGLQEKPFVYRALIPWLAHLLVILGLRADLALTLLVVLSALGLLYGIKYLLASFRGS